MLEYDKRPAARDRLPRAAYYQAFGTFHVDLDEGDFGLRRDERVQSGGAHLDFLPLAAVSEELPPAQSAAARRMRQYEERRLAGAVAQRGFDHAYAGELALQRLGKQRNRLEG